MDPIAHSLTGLLIAKSFGAINRKSLILAVAASWAPDIDIVSWGMNNPPEWFVHRSALTHSFFFAAVLAAPFAMLFARQENWSIKKSCFLSLLLLGLHVFGDSLTSYGTPIWAPFSRQNHSFDLLSGINIIPSALVGLSLVVAAKKSPRLGLLTGWISLLTLLSGTLVLKNKTERLLIQKEPQVAFSAYPHLIWPWKFRAVGENRAFYELYTINPLKNTAKLDGRFPKPGNSRIIENSKKAGRVRWLLKHARWPIARVEKTAQGYKVIWGNLLFIQDEKSTLGGVAAQLDKNGNLAESSRGNNLLEFLNIRLLLNEILIRYYSYRPV